MGNITEIGSLTGGTLVLVTPSDGEGLGSICKARVHVPGSMDRTERKAARIVARPNDVAPGQ